MRGSALGAFAAVVLLLEAPAVVLAETASQPSLSAGAPVNGVAVSAEFGAIQGIVQDERGTPLGGAMVTALGASPAFTVTDPGGRFELQTLTPGPYLLRAHLAGFVASRGQTVEVRPSGRVSSAIALKRAANRQVGSIPVFEAGMGGAPPDVNAPEPHGDEAPPDAAAGDDDHTELAWRLTHARRSVFKDVTVPAAPADDAGGPATPDEGTAGWASAAGSRARMAASLLAGLPLSGEVNFLTTGSFDSPQQLFASDSFARGIAYVSLGQTTADRSDWSVRAAVSQGDSASWILSGAYTAPESARHRYDVGLSYSMQRFDGINAPSIGILGGGTHSAGALHGFDTWTITRSVSLAYGGSYTRYDYVNGRGLVSPRAVLTVQPLDHYRVNMVVSRRALAPGAEEFLPPADSSVWLPPERTFSSLAPDGSLRAEQTDHLEMEIERDFIAGTSVSARAFRQYIQDQLVTLFGMQLPGEPLPALGHYFVGNAGDASVGGYGLGLHRRVGRHIRGTIEYSSADGRWAPQSDLAYMILVGPAAVRPPARIHDLSTSLETELPETATRVFVLCRVSNGFAREQMDRPSVDSRFDVQVHQSLPFMNFSAAHWEALLDVRSLFRDMSSDASMYDELLVTRPPTRVVGGLTLKF